MKNRIFPILYFTTVFAIYGLPATADTIISDDLIVQGSQCVGSDCVDGLDFAGDTFRLQENNLRIRLHDTSAPDILGQSWSLTANDSANGGSSFLSFELKSLTTDTIRFSDGTAPLYDCSVAVPISPSQLPPIIGVIPFGDPVTTPQNPVFDAATSTLTYECLTVADYTVKPILKLGASVDDNVTLGFDSKPEAGAISMGNPTLLRQLKHVAAGIADTDVLVTQTLNDSGYEDQQTLIATLRDQFTALETQVSEIEDKVFNNQAPTTPVLTSPDNDASGLATSVTFSWEVSTDANGDTLQYRVSVCELADFGGCNPEVVAASDFSGVFAGLIGGGSGMLLLAGIVLPNLRKRRRVWVYGACLVSVIMLVTACSGGGGTKAAAGKSHTVSGLKPGTQYFWKVTATDFIDVIDSEVRSFTTQ